MKLVTYQSNGAQSRGELGALVGEKVVSLKQVLESCGESCPADMIGLLSEWAVGMDKVAKALAAVGTDTALSVDQVTLLPPVPRPGKVIALGRNYAAHAAEGGAEPPDYPMLFHKTATSLLGAGGTIVIPPVSDKIDYEAELAVIIGKECKAVSEAEALDYVAGYTVANDVSARDWQRRTTQFTAGKMLDTFGPLGPALVTKDEVADPGNLWIRTTLNGNIMQDGHTSMMIFSVPFLISYISQISTLEVGDVIMTGTPEGVGYARKPPVWLKEGDTVTIEVEGLGALTNQVANQK